MYPIDTSGMRGLSSLESKSPSVMVCILQRSLALLFPAFGDFYMLKWSCPVNQCLVTEWQEHECSLCSNIRPNHSHQLLCIQWELLFVVSYFSPQWNQIYEPNFVKYFKLLLIKQWSCDYNEYSFMGLCWVLVADKEMFLTGPLPLSCVISHFVLSCISKCSAEFLTFSDLYLLLHNWYANISL